jgi:hypothetical protein
LAAYSGGRQQLDILEIDMPVVFINIKCVYGVMKFYPDPSNATALRLAKLTGTKTFSTSDIATIKALGFEIQYVDAYAGAQV